jgi:hypothetical protein
LRSGSRIFSAHTCNWDENILSKRRVCKSDERQTSFQRRAFVAVVPGATFTAEK